MSESNGVPDEDADNLVTAEGVNERGTDAEAAGRSPGGPGDRDAGPEGAGAEAPDDERRTEGTESTASTAPGSAVGPDHGALDAAPEPNEPG
jgi:hypothetical protein